MKTPTIYKLSLILMFSVNFTLAQTPNIIINEFLTSNAHINYDPDYKNYSDWFELYNIENYPINLNGYYLTDDLTNPTKWSITNDLTIEAASYLVFWADDEDNGVHTNFKLNNDGEQIGIYNPDGDIVDTVIFNTQQTDISYGRNPNNVNEWLFYYNPTPGGVNNTIGNADLVNSSLPIFSVNGGFYATDISLEITVDQDAEIRYTLDGSEPDENSEIYTVPINISDRSGEPNYFSEIPTTIQKVTYLPPWYPPLGKVRKATIVRAKVFADGKIPSSIVTHSYFIGSNMKSDFSTIPVISLISDEKHFFSDSAGIYVPGQSQGNYEYDWTRPVEIQFFAENGDLEISQEVDIRIQGFTSRHSPQKALHVIARSKYGKSSIDYQLFKNGESKANKLTSFKRFIIRAWGGMWNQGMLNDALSQLSYAKSSLDIQDYRPTIVFINGEYWGLQAIREANKNPYYYQEHHGIDKDNPGVDILIGGIPYYSIDEGDDIHWKELYNFILANDLSIPQNYEYIKTQMDVDNFIDYIEHTIFFNKRDWPEGNQAFWRPKTADGRWKWIQYDMDACLVGATYDKINRVYNGDGNGIGRHMILIELTKNQQFKIKFINRFLDRINSDFKSDIIQNKYNNLLYDIYPYLNEHQNRWAQSSNNFTAFTAYISDFIVKRPDNVVSHLQSHFNLGKLNSVIIGGINNNGTVKINSLLVDENTPGYIETKNEWSGKYFEDVPITLIALPNEGFVFDHWEGSIDSHSDSITINLTTSAWLSPIFSPKIRVDSLCINEILVNNDNFNTDSTGDYDDWIEIYNTSSDTINLAGLYLTDDFSNPTKWKIPVADSISFSIFPEEYKIIWCDGEPQEGLDHVGFSLNKLGEQIGLIQITGNDTVFIDSLSFPEQLPNISYGRFPDTSNKWEFMLLPTPGSSNVFKPIPYDQLTSPELFQNYPNPFNLNTSIPFYLSEVNDVTIDIYNIKGRLVRSFADKQKDIGYYEILWDSRDNHGNAMSSGVYFYRIQVDNFIKVKKMLFLK